MASGTIGFRVYFNGEWFQGSWLPHMRLDEDQGISIEWQERS